MFFYWSIWFFFLLLSILWKDKHNIDKFNYYLLLLFLVIMALITGGRDSVGSDWASYKALYLWGVSEAGMEIDEIDPLYRLSIIAGRSVGLSYGMFCFVISLLSLWAFWLTIKIAKVKNCWLAFLVYLSLVFCYYQFNIVRHGVMSSFVLLGMVLVARYYNKNKEVRKKEGKITYKDLLLGVISIVVGAGFHSSGLMFLLFVPFIHRRLSNFSLWLIVVLGFGLYFLHANDLVELAMKYLFVSTRYENYLDTSRWSDAQLTIGTLGKVFIFLYAYYGNGKLYKENILYRQSVNLLLFALFFSVAFSEYGIVVNRLGNTMALSLAIVLPYLSYYSNKGELMHFAVNTVIYIYLGLYYPTSFMDRNMLPFTFEISNLFSN